MAVPSDSSRTGAHRQALAQLFGPAVQDHEECMTECLSLLRLYSLSPQDLFYKFEAFSLSSLAPESRSNPTLQDFRALRQSLQASIDSALAAQTPKRGGLNGSAASAWGSSSGAAASARKKPGAGMGTLFGTPGSASRAPSSSASAMQTPSRNPASSALRRGGGGGGGSALAGDDSMDLDDSPSRPRATSSTPAWTVSQTLNSHIPAPRTDQVQASSSRVRLMHGRPPNAYPTRYMFERGAERGEALDDYLETMSTLLVEAYALSEEDLADPSLVHQESVYVVGRICPNLVPGGGANGSKQNSSTGAPRLQPTQTGTLIESSKLQGAGQRVPIWLTDTCTLRRPPGPDDEEGDEEEDVSGVDILGMFPGMIVGLKGRNGGGMGFGVEEILLLPPLPLPATLPSQMLETQYSPKLLNGGPMSILVASGPYTSEHNLDFAPWHALMDNVERSHATSPLDVLILLGPFLPVSHPLLPFSSALPSDLFKQHFAPRLNALSPAGSSRTATLLVPSHHDALCAHAAFPQPGSAYDRAELGLSKGVRPLPNPALFSVADVVFGAGTADVLRDLRAEELVRRLPKRAGAGASQSQSQSQAQSQSQDALARSVRHVLSQRSFYPLFPPPQPRGGGGAGAGAGAGNSQAPAAAAATADVPSADADADADADAAAPDFEPEAAPEPEPPLPLSLPSLALTGFTTVTPDVLILPSGTGAHYSGGTQTQTQPFAKIVDGVVVINPGGAASAGGTARVQGTAARLTIRALDRAKLGAAAAAGGAQAEGREEEAMEHAVWERCRVDLLRF